MEEISEKKSKNQETRVVYERDDQSFWEKCLDGKWHQVFPPFPDATVLKWDKAPI